MLEYLKRLIDIPSPSGREQKIAEYIFEQMRPYFDSVTTDALGNLICRKNGGSSERIMFCAHMDEIGFMVTYIEKDGFLRAAPLGGIDYSAAAYGRVVFEHGVSGEMVPEANVKPENYEASGFLCDIGAENAEQAEAMVAVGDCFTLRSSVDMLAGRRVCGRPMDDKLGCAILMAAARDHSSEFHGDVYFVFTVQEELGLRGSRCAAFAIEPDVGIAVDVTDTGDVKGAEPMEVRLGGGAAVKIKDKGSICDSFVVERLRQLARDKEIPVQLEILTRGSTDAAAIQLAGAGAKAGCISIPARYIHSGVETVDMGDADACCRLIAAAACGFYG